MWRGLKTGEFKPPKSINEEIFKRLKQKKENSALHGLVGFGASFGGDYFSGYIQKYSGSSKRNFYQETLRSIKKMEEVITRKDVYFYNKGYEYWKVKNHLIYCDPPYKNTTGYKTGDFNHEIFWETMKKWSKDNYVFISEEQAPVGFVSIWEHSKARTLHPVKTKMFHRTEKLYIYKYGKAYKYIQKLKKQQTAKNAK